MFINHSCWIDGDFAMAGKAKAANKKMMRGGMAKKKMMRGGMAKKKMMRGGAVKKK